MQKINDLLSKKDKIKIGFDFHGVLDTFPSFVLMTNLLCDAGHEVHIITGIKQDKSVEDILVKLGVVFTHYFSIVDHLESIQQKQNSTIIEWKDGLPYADSNVWNPVKSIYCSDNNIDLLFDDSPVYGDYFDNISTVYCHVKNIDRIKYNVR